MNDACKVAKERAYAMQPMELEAELRQQDAKYRAVAVETISRIQHVLVKAISRGRRVSLRKSKESLRARGRR